MSMECASSSPAAERCEEIRIDAELEDIFRGSFLPAIERGDVEKVRAILYALRQENPIDHEPEEPERSEAEEAEHCKSKSGTARGSDTDRVYQLVNLACPFCKKSSLYLALGSLREDIAHLLLQNGADPRFCLLEEDDVVPGDTHAYRRQLAALVQLNEHERFSFCTRTRAHLLTLRHNVPYPISCLDVAVTVGSVEMAHDLIAAGAEVKMNTWMCWWQRSCREGEIRNLYLVLSDRGQRPVPFWMAVHLMHPPWTPLDNDELCFLPQNVLWCFSPGGFSTTLWSVIHLPRSYSLLRCPARGLLSHFSKAFFLQVLLTHIPSFGNTIREVGPLLNILLQEGVNIHGWTDTHAMVMQRAWRYLDHHEEVKDGARRHPSQARNEARAERLSEPSPSLWSFRNMSVACSLCHMSLVREQLGIPRLESVIAYDSFRHLRTEGYLRGIIPEPQMYSFTTLCILPAVSILASPSRTDSLVEMILSQTRVKWLEDPQRLPSNGHGGFLLHHYKVHDGPTCHDHVQLSDEQKRISLKMCTSSGGSMQLLMSLCRDVITLACLEHSENIFSAVEKLPLPPRMKCYLLSN